jgi:hypothetical protein
LDKGSTARAGDYILLYGKGKENHKLGTGFFGSHIREVTVKRTELVIVRISYIAQKDRWCNNNYLNAHAPMRKVTTQRTAFMRNCSRFSNIFLNTI